MRKRQDTLVAGRTIIIKNKLTCYRATVLNKFNVSGMLSTCIVTEHGTFRTLAGEINADDIEIGETYFFQTVCRNFGFAKIQIVDFTKIVKS